MEKVLIVEDDLANGVAGLEAMKEIGLDALLVSCAEDAIKLLDEEDFVAVLSDLIMPISENGSLVDAGKIVVRECINRCIPSAIVTGGGIGHHGKPCIKVVIPEPMFAIDSPVKKFSLEKEKEIDSKSKDVRVWEKAYKVLLEKVGGDPVCVAVATARKRYRRYVGKPFCRDRLANYFLGNIQ